MTLLYIESQKDQTHHEGGLGNRLELVTGRTDSISKLSVTNTSLSSTNRQPDTLISTCGLQGAGLSRNPEHDIPLGTGVKLRSGHPGRVGHPATEAERRRIVIVMGIIGVYTRNFGEWPKHRRHGGIVGMSQRFLCRGWALENPHNGYGIRS